MILCLLPQKLLGRSVVNNNFRFNGFTEYWQDINENRIRYGNLFRMNIPDQRAAIMQAKVNLAEALDMPGLQMQGGIFKRIVGAALCDT